MDVQPDLKLPLRALLESTGTRFGVARYGRGAKIFCQGDDARTVLHVEQGRAWLAVTTPSGKEGICDVVGPGGFLGEEVLANQRTRPHTATAMIATDVLVVARVDMVRLLHTQPEVSEHLIAHALERSIRLQNELADQLLCTSEERLAHTLLMLASCDERHPCSCALPPVSQEVIAEMVGTTRSRINFFMARFRKSGLLRKENGVIHVNGRLMRRIDHDHHAM